MMGDKECKRWKVGSGCVCEREQQSNFFGNIEHRLKCKLREVVQYSFKYLQKCWGGGFGWSTSESLSESMAMAQGLNA